MIRRLFRKQYGRKRFLQKAGAVAVSGTLADVFAHTASAIDTVGNIPELADQMWDQYLMNTTKTGRWFLNSGQTAPGSWLAAKQLKDRIKAAAAAPPPPPPPLVLPMVTIVSPLEGDSLTGMFVVSGTAF